MPFVANYTSSIKVLVLWRKETKTNSCTPNTANVLICLVYCQHSEPSRPIRTHPATPMSFPNLAALKVFMPSCNA